MDLPLTLFLFVVNSKMMKLDRARASWVLVEELFGCLPMKNCISLSRKGCFLVLVPPLQYSPCIRGEENEIRMSLQMDFCLGVPGWRVVSKVWTMLMGRGRTLIQGGSAFLYEA